MMRILQTVERYDPTTKKWRPVASMNKPRGGVAVGVLNGFLYAVNCEKKINTGRDKYLCVYPFQVGGHDIVSHQSLSSVECYSPETDTWTPIRDMVLILLFVAMYFTNFGHQAHRRGGAAIGVLDGYLYVIGGNYDSMVHRSVERFDPASKTWTRVANMSIGRRYAGYYLFYSFKIFLLCIIVVSFFFLPKGVATHDGLLYVVGGSDGTTTLNSAEVYNPTTNTWSMLPACMTIGRSCPGIVVIDRPFWQICKSTDSHFSCQRSFFQFYISFVQKSVPKISFA